MPLDPDILTVAREVLEDTKLSAESVAVARKIARKFPQIEQAVLAPMLVREIAIALDSRACRLAQAVIDLSAALSYAPKIPDQAWTPDRLADFVDTYSNWYFEVAKAALDGKDLGGLVKGGA